MTILKDISVIWSLIHALFIFLLLFEPRYQKGKTIALSLATMIPLIIINLAIFIIVDAERYMTLLLLTCTLPSLIFFWFLAKNRDGRFFFTFCLVDTLGLEIIYITNIIDYYLGETYIFMFAARMICFPLLEFLIYKKFRTIYIKMQQSTQKGWYTFAVISAIFYVALSLSMSYPTMITSRPEYLPAFLLLLVLMPVIYIHIFNTLRSQQKAYEIAGKENILRLQVANMRSRIEEFSAANAKSQEERHDFHHKLNTISVLAKNGQTEEIINLIQEYTEMLPEKTVKSYCEYPVIDAVLSSDLQRAERKGIHVTTKISFPAPLPASEAELATAFANALENAINACEKVEPSKRFIEVQVLTDPCFMIQIQNSFDGLIAFDQNDIPMSDKKGHGFGTRSIVTFCEKNDAFYEFKASDHVFYLRIIFR